MFKIFHQLNCKSSDLIYLLQRQKDSKNKNPVQGCKPFLKFKSWLSKGCEVSPNSTNYKNLYNYQIVTANFKETGKLLDSKTENILPRWFEPRT